MKHIRIIILLLLASASYSFEVDKLELELTSTQTITFENYNGPYSFVNTVDEIRNIGDFLAKGLIQGSRTSASFSNKYSMHHIPKLEWENTFKSADVFVIHEDALVDNTANLQLIISQYLISFYSYSVLDSLTLSKLILIYNGVYRGDAEHYQSIYSPDSLISENSDYLGIDTKYYNWPGKTFLYIPITQNLLLNQIPTVDSDLFLETETMDYIKNNTEDSISFREEIISFKENELNSRIELLSNKEESITIEIEELEKEKELANDLEIKQIDKDILVLEDQIEELKIESKKINVIDEKILEIRDDVAKDKNKEISISKKTDKFLYYNIKRSTKGDLGEFIYLDNSGNIINSSEINSIRKKSFYIDSKSIYAIAGGFENNHRLALVNLDRESLKTLNISEIDIYEESEIVVNKNLVFVVSSNQDKYRVAMLDNKLSVLGFSPMYVLKDSFIIVKENRIYIQASDYNIIFINFDDFVLE